MSERCDYDCRFPSAGLDDARFKLNVAQVQEGMIDINYRDYPEEEDYWGIWRVRAIEMRHGKPVLILVYA